MRNLETRDCQGRESKLERIMFTRSILRLFLRANREHGHHEETTSLLGKDREEGEPSHGTTESGESVPFFQSRSWGVILVSLSGTTSVTISRLQDIQTYTSLSKISDIPNSHASQIFVRNYLLNLCFVEENPSFFSDIIRTECNTGLNRVRHGNTLSYWR